MKSISRFYFNMIEVVLAIGLVAIGVVSIMGLFPIGMNATRDSIAQSMAAALGDQLLHQTEYLIRNTPNGWTTYIVNAPTIYIDDAFSTSDLGAFDHNDTNEGQAANTPKSLYLNKNRQGVYKALGFCDRNDTEGTPEYLTYDSDDFLDFEGMVKVWIEDIVIEGNTLPRTLAARLHVQVSWPAPAPYAGRQTASYCLEMFNR